jgi:hypothetical protein
MDLSEQPVAQSFLRHPWELAKRDFLLQLVRSFMLDSKPAFILDAGAGDGWIGTELLDILPKGSSLISWDIHYRTPSAPTGRQGQRLTATLGDDDSGDLLLLLDVLEHVDAPHRWLAALVSNHLMDHGHAIVSVPAWPFLYGRHDRALKHQCRFHPDIIRGLIEGAGLDVICQGGLFLSLLPARVLSNVLDHLLQPTHPCPNPERLAWRWGRLTHLMVAGLLAFDCRIALALAKRQIAVPGLSWWALCRKR